jgi:DNA-binding response OmpR family regulator
MDVGRGGRRARLREERAMHKRVLIVDDEPHLRLLYETELRRAGFDTMSAANAEQGLEFVDSMRPDLVVLDIRMPGMDGVEALQRILDRDNTIPVVLNTAYSSYRDNFMTWAADAYVTKSSDVGELVSTVRELLHEETVSQ